MIFEHLPGLQGDAFLITHGLFTVLHFLYFCILSTATVNYLVNEWYTVMNHHGVYHRGAFPIPVGLTFTCG
jgi:hypothetical protein